MLFDNTSLQATRLRAINAWNNQLKNTNIVGIADVLRIGSLSHHYGMFEQQQVDLVAAFFLTENDMYELGLTVGEAIIFTRILEKMRKLPIEGGNGLSVENQLGLGAADGIGASNVADDRVTKFVKGRLFYLV